MHLRDPPPSAPVAHEVQHHREGRRQLAVQREPVESGRRAERLEPGRHISRGVGVDRAGAARMNALTVHATDSLEGHHAQANRRDL
ncbi:hypothetical protein SSRG_02854 [Streptomyces griseoflavus Tu4000]|uniref:Uncharacterized protein n=1 Tax=Streptomyces griseoflavus Tu4000 TaxID=467200 RepID=D9Y1G6_9ACTN|nr:hypothetical protein SSRG_02854 [Streptomyces griseoflavus Tu4000]